MRIRYDGMWPLAPATPEHQFAADTHGAHNIIYKGRQNDGSPKYTASNNVAYADGSVRASDIFVFNNPAQPSRSIWSDTAFDPDRLPY
jgi:prepilin-type processing-associated H-X9-DG protein